MLTRLAFGFALLPIAGLGLASAFCLGHPLQALGAGAVVLGPLLALAAGLAGWAKGLRGPLAITALALGALEIVGLLVMLILTL
jgi:hypothetical protein